MAVGIKLPTEKEQENRKGGREQRMNSTQPMLKREEEEDGERTKKKGVREQNIIRVPRQVMTFLSLSASIAFLLQALFWISKITSLYLTPSFLQVKLCSPPFRMLLPSLAQCACLCK